MGTLVNLLNMKKEDSLAKEGPSSEKRISDMLNEKLQFLKCYKCNGFGSV
jgi:hypothetical protein